MTASSLASLQIPFRTLLVALFVYVAAADQRWTIDGPIALLGAIGSSGLAAIRICGRVRMFNLRRHGFPALLAGVASYRLGSDPNRGRDF